MLPQYTHRDPACEAGDRADPVNIIFESAQVADVGELFKMLPTYTYTGRRWRKSRLGEASDQWIETAAGTQKQDLQLVNGTMFERFHVRLWEYESLVVGGAHYEPLFTYGGNRRFGELHSAQFDRGKNMVCAQIQGHAYSVEPNQIAMGNETPGFSGSGSAALIQLRRGSS